MTNTSHSNYQGHSYQNSLITSHQHTSNNYHPQHQQTPAIQTAILIPSNIISFGENVHQNGYQHHHHHLSNQQMYNNHDHHEINSFENEDEQNSNVIFV